MSKYVTYKGQLVSVRKELSKEELDSLKQDAERIMGLRLTLTKRDRPEAPRYLEPPPEGDSTREWAEEILSLEYPAVEIWVGRPVIVSLSELSPLELSNV